MRNHHPYTATSLAITIRHAVSIDERRAKFRQDLLGIVKPKSDRRMSKTTIRQLKAGIEEICQPRRETIGPGGTLNITTKKEKAEPDAGIFNPRYRRSSVTQIQNRSMERGRRSFIPARSLDAVAEDDERSVTSASYSIPPRLSARDLEQLEDEEAEENLSQDILEVWFSGGHGDIGGGWIPKRGEILLSHIPLAWMVREASRSGFRFDPEKVAEMNCGWEGNKNDFMDSYVPPAAGIPQVQVTGTESPKPNDGLNPERDAFHKHLHRAATESIVHDCLAFGGGLGTGTVSAWTFMEYLPFRRMDLQPDDTWRSVRFPLPSMLSISL